MLIRIHHESGRVLTMRVSQVVVMAENETPLAVAYDQQNTVVHSSATEADWPAVCRELGLGAVQAEVLRT